MAIVTVRTIHVRTQVVQPKEPCHVTVTLWDYRTGRPVSGQARTVWSGTVVGRHGSGRR